MRGSSYNCTSTIGSDRDYVIVNDMGVKADSFTALSRKDVDRFIARHRASVAGELGLPLHRVCADKGAKAVTFSLQLPSSGNTVACACTWDVVFSRTTYAPTVHLPAPFCPVNLPQARCAVRALKLLQGWRRSMPQLRGMLCEALVAHFCNCCDGPKDCLSIFVGALRVITSCSEHEQLVPLLQRQTSFSISKVFDSAGKRPHTAHVQEEFAVPALA